MCILSPFVFFHGNSIVRGCILLLDTLSLRWLDETTARAIVATALSSSSSSLAFFSPYATCGSHVQLLFCVQDFGGDHGDDDDDEHVSTSLYF